MREFDLVRDRSEWLIRFGCVYVEHERTRSNVVVSNGQYLRIHLDPKRYPVEEVGWRSAIVHEDEAFIVIRKPAIIPVHPTVDNYSENALYQLSAMMGVRLFTTQRLDTEVSGLMVFAKSVEFQRRFNDLLSERAVRKHYRALVRTVPALGRHVHYMTRSARAPKTVTTTPGSDSLECALSIVQVKPLQNVFEVEIQLETGRTHQMPALHPLTLRRLFGCLFLPSRRGSSDRRQLQWFFLREPGR